MRRIFIISWFLLLPSAAMAQATESSSQPQVDTRLKQRFEAADTDHDGKLTLAEAQKGMPRLASRFSSVDVDGKGYVTLDQLEALMASHAHG